MKRTNLVILTAGLVACGSGQRYLATSPMVGEFQEAAVTAVITSALDAEAAGIPSDTLFTTSRTIVVNGRSRSSSPLFAGIGEGGQVVIASSQMEIRQTSSWGLVDYRWQSPTGIAREGRATFILTQLDNKQWKIQHLHSSSPQ